MLEVLAIILIIIFSPVILIAGLISLFVILGIIYTIIAIPIGIINKIINYKKQVRKWQKKVEDQESIKK